MRVATDLELEFPSSEGGETQVLNNVPIVVSLPVPHGFYGNTEFQLIVTIILNNERNERNERKELFRQFVTKWK